MQKTWRKCQWWSKTQESNNTAQSYLVALVSSPLDTALLHQKWCQGEARKTLVLLWLLVLAAMISRTYLVDLSSHHLQPTTTQQGASDWSVSPSANKWWSWSAFVWLFFFRVPATFLTWPCYEYEYFWIHNQQQVIHWYMLKPCNGQQKTTALCNVTDGTTFGSNYVVGFLHNFLTKF
jgi:hypothetical protein